MSCNVEKYKTYDAPVLAGTSRFLLGLGLMLVSLYTAILSDIQGHALGFLLAFGSLFIIFQDEK
jgi:hypothetical protein